MTDNTASALCYALGFITGILFLVLAPYNQKKNIRFHAFQSIFLHVAAIVFYIGFGIVFGVLLSILGIWFAVFSPLFWLVRLAGLLLWVMMMVWAYQGKTVVLPVIGPLAKQQA